MAERLQKSLQNNPICSAYLLFPVVICFNLIMTDEIADIIEFPTDR